MPEQIQVKHENNLIISISDNHRGQAKDKNFIEKSEIQIWSFEINTKL